MKILSSIFIAFIYMILFYFCVIVFSAHGIEGAKLSLSEIFNLSIFMAPVIMLMCLLNHIIIKKFNAILGYFLIAFSIYSMSYLSESTSKATILACLYYLLIFYLLRLFNDFRSKLGKK